MKIRNTILLALFTLFFACNKQQPEQKGTPVIILKESKDILPISSFTSKVDYLELKVSEVGVELGEIEDVKIIDDDLIIKHRMAGMNRFIRFTKGGDFVIEIVGDKTSQIKKPEDLIAYKDGYAVLAENGIHAITREGKYLQQLVRSDTPGTRFFFADGTFYILNESSLGEVIIKVPSKSMLKSYLLPEIVKRNTYAMVENLGREGLHYYSVLNDTVFSYQKGISKPAYVLCGDEMPTFVHLCDSLPGKNEKEILKYVRETEHVVVRKYFENNDYIYLSYWVGSDPTTAIYNKKSEEIRYFGFGVNDLDGGMWDEILFLSDKNELYIPITAYKISGHKISNKKVKGFDRLQAQIAKSGNPVLMRCKLR